MALNGSLRCSDQPGHYHDMTGLVKLTSGFQDCTRLPTLGSMPSGPRPSTTPRESFSPNRADLCGCDAPTDRCRLSAFAVVSRFTVRSAPVATP